MGPVITAVPLDRHAVAIPAETYIDKQGHEVLRLSQNSVEQPRVTVIILPYDSNLELLHKYNMNTTKYPRNLITYVYQEKDRDLRSYVESADTDIIIIMSADTMYLPHSIYAKVKLLEKYSAVGTCQIYKYHINCGKGELLPTSKYPASGTMAFKRHFFLEYPDCQRLDAYFYDNRWDNIATIACNFNCISISMDDELTPGGTLMPPRMLSSSAKEFIVSKLLTGQGHRN